MPDNGLKPNIPNLSGALFSASQIHDLWEQKTEKMASFKAVC